MEIYFLACNRMINITIFDTCIQYRVHGKYYVGEFKFQIIANTMNMCVYMNDIHLN